MKGLGLILALVCAVALVGCSKNKVTAPRPSAQRAATSGPGGGFVQCLAVIGTSLFAGTRTAGVFRSTSNGASWTATGLTRATAVNAIGGSATTLLAGAYEGVFRSTDNGAS
jgi:hypothetical protein